MTNPSQKTSAQQLGLFMCTVLSPVNLEVPKREVVSLRESRVIAMISRKLFELIKDDINVPAYLLGHMCTIFATLLTCPKPCYRFAELCKARVTYVHEKYGHLGDDDVNDTLANKTLHKCAIEFFDTFEEISDGNAHKMAYLHAVSLILVALMTESIVTKPGFEPKDLFRGRCPVEHRLTDILTKWMASCGIPILHYL